MAYRHYTDNTVALPKPGEVWHGSDSGPCRVERIEGDRVHVASTVYSLTGTTSLEDFQRYRETNQGRVYRWKRLEIGP